MKTPVTRGGGTLFLGLDFSTQGLKAVLIDSAGRIAHEDQVVFDRDLPRFGTRGGVHRGADGLAVTAPPRMWTAAFDRLLDRMRRARWPLARLAAVSGAGQQHGSVYWTEGARARLAALDPRRPLAAQVGGLFAVPDSPVWMDSSTGPQCRARDAALGGPAAAARLTGSRSYERFTGNQIAKIAQQQPDAYRRTERIALVSSFAAALLIGGYAPLEPGDAAGMNLMDIRTRRWAPAALACTAPGLARRLGAIVPSHRAIGRLHPYYAARYGWAPRALVIAFTGDNPSSLAALGLTRPGDIAVSLGTSDTVFGALAAPRPSAVEGHIFGNPIAPRGWMALLCFKNGSLAREWVRDRRARGSWAAFEAALAHTPPGNVGRIGFFFLEPEITPPVFVPGVRRFDPSGRAVRAFPPEAEIRAVVEGQCLAMRLHADRIGLKARAIVATGGGSVNASLLQVMADVFNAPVSASDRPASAAFGGALRALHGWHCARAQRFVPFAAVAPPLPTAVRLLPRSVCHRLYRAIGRRYARLEAAITSSGSALEPGRDISGA